METIIKVTNLKTCLDGRLIHNRLNLSVAKGEIYGLLGPSGCGKTTLLREMVMLQEIHSGDIEILGCSLGSITQGQAQKLRQQWGVLFQYGALFSSLSVYENIALPLQEYTDLSESMIDEIVKFKIDIVGLKRQDASLYPSQISGGMKKSGVGAGFGDGSQTAVFGRTYKRARPDFGAGV